jgi:hypothetical protein
MIITLIKQLTAKYYTSIDLESNKSMRTIISTSLTVSLEF